MNAVKVFDIPEILPLGRFQEEKARKAGVLPLFWAGSGLEVRFTGSELHLILEADFEHKEPWITVEVNGARLIRMPLGRGENDVCVFRGMYSGSEKRVVLWKECQPMSDDPSHRLWVKGISWDGGNFLPASDHTFRLEFVGDSITSGEGAIGARKETDWAAALFSSSRTWAHDTARALDAECRIISQGGWGIRSGWDNDPSHALPDIYERICSPAGGKENETIGAQESYDFSSWQPDAVIVNLGTNDATAMAQPAWRGDGGHVFRQQNTPKSLSATVDAAAAFLRKLRKCNPSAHLVWAYGMMGDLLRPQLEMAVERVRRETGDRRIHYLQLPSMTSESMGALGHPGFLCNREAAETLIELLKDIL